MSHSIALILLGLITLSVAEPMKPGGCVIPETGPQKGIMPKGCSTEVKNPIELLGGESQIRCKILDVKCNPQKKGEYLATAKVDQWLRGVGPQKVEFRFDKTQKKLGRGLCADLTLERQNANWFLTKIENRTSSSDSLPVCP